MRNQNIRLFGNVKRLTLAAMLVAISVIVGIFCKNFLNFGNGLLRVTFEGLPIIMSGIIFGPIVGGVVGFAADFISFFLSTQTFAISPIVSIAAALLGIIPGIIVKYVLRKRTTFSIVLSASIAHIICSMIIKPIGLFVYYQWAVLVRIPLYMVIAPLEILVICSMFKNSGFVKLIDELVPLKQNKL